MILITVSSRWSLSNILIQQKLRHARNQTLPKMLMGLRDSCESVKKHDKRVKHENVLKN